MPDSRRSARAGLQVLKIGLNKKITDAGLTHLKKLTKLRHLDLCVAHMSDAGGEHLRQLGNLEHLEVCAEDMTNQGLARLSELKHLRHIKLTAAVYTEAPPLPMRAWFVCSHFPPCAKST